MWSRSEQVQAYRFLTRRIGSAVLSGEPETNELPMRRFALAVFGSAVLAALVFAGFAVYGLLRPASRQPVANTIIVERETGAKYLFLQGLLHPVLNWTSARLILAQAKPPVRTMSQSSLRDVPRGRPVGIPNAPDALPARNGLVGLPVSVCSAPRSAASVEPASHVLVGRVPAGGAPVDAGKGLLVSIDDDGAQRYLLWRGHRLRIRDNATLAALGWAAVRPARVGVGFLNAVPPGPDLAPPKVPGAGSTARVQVAGDEAEVGDLFRAADQFYVMLRDGLSPVGETAARLLEAGGTPVADITAQDAGRVLVKTAVEPPDFPTDVPAAKGADERFAVACAVYRAAGDAAQAATIETFATVDGGLTLSPEQTAPAPAGTDGVLTADRVTLPGGRAALVSAATPPGSTAPGAVYLLTDQGLKHPLPAANAGQIQGFLGYEGVRPVPVPPIVLALIPTATVLDPEAATLLAPPPTLAPARPDE